jgi:glycosyltransferase involved in cell wall biosynthesis
LRIWLLKPGEPVWSDGEDVRLHRTGSLAEYLAKDGHDVVWWTSTFYHPRKIHRFSTDTTLTHGDRIRIEMLHSPGYPKNVSLRRLFDHRKLAQAFRERTRTADRPDLIVTALPTIEFCVESVEYGRRSGVPVVIDVRDLWPDTFVDVLPRALRPVARQAVRPYVAGARLALRSADGIVAMSQGCLAWGLNLAGRHGRDTDRVFPLGYRGTTPDTGADHPETTDLIRRGVDPTKLICWFIGTFGRMYDIGTIIEGARRCARAGRADVQFVISGEGDQRERWITLARGLDNVVFTGWLESREIHYMMSIADIM